MVARFASSFAVLRRDEDKKDGKGGKETFTFKQEDARYVRMFGEQRKTNFGYSLWEFEVYAK